MKKEQSNVASLEPNVDSLRSNVASLESKFKVGDKVRIIGSGTEAGKAKIGEVGEVLDIDTRNNACFVLYRKGQDWVRVCDLEPYTGSETKEVCPYADDRTCNTCMGKGWCDYKPKANMEEKELNLCELLKGCEGKRFYLLSRGYTTLKGIIWNKDTCDYSIVLTGKGRIELYCTGKETNNEAVVILYPSKELYEKYPLDAYSAWMEWAEARKPKRWTPQVGERIFFVNSHGAVSQDFCRSDEEGNEHQLKRRAIGNEFRTGKAAETFAKIFRETLAIFHEKNAGRDI